MKNVIQSVFYYFILLYNLILNNLLFHKLDLIVHMGHYHTILQAIFVCWT